ncbi:MAG: hypothetical protein PHV34_10775 [Verrucomicrobiae bacterium]|nr:hypothetical protein [Verrucomicrobiae bacterium]
MRIDLDLPPETPEGEADVVLIIESCSIPKDTSLDDLIGCLRDSKTFEGDSIETQRRLRDEWS